jgi:hypothetical protein
VMILYFHEYREDQVREGSGLKQGSHIKVGVNLLVDVDIIKLREYILDT